MISGPTLRLLSLAVLGILVAAAVAIAASQLASHQIGLASESVLVGDELAPPIARPRHGDLETGGRTERSLTPPNHSTRAATPEPESSPALPAPAESIGPGDSSAGREGEGGGDGGGGGGGDD